MTSHPPAELDDDILLFETSPYGNIDAIVQRDSQTVYFYLNGRPNPDGSPNPFGTRACWVRNLQTGPYVINEDDLNSGIQPMLPRTHTVSPQPGPLPDRENLQIVWLEEGNGAALLEQPSSPSEPGNPVAAGLHNTLAVIPPWSGSEGFLGYAAECAAESPLCWPLPANPQLQQRIENAAEFWNSFDQSPDPFALLQPQILSAYEQRFSEVETIQQQDYFAIDGNRFPPRGLVHFETDRRHILATVAMSLCPQPNVELHTETPSHFRRIELAIEMPPETPQSVVDAASKKLSGLAAYPWQRLNWFGHGHTCDFSRVLTDVENVELVDDRQRHPQDPILLPKFRGDPVSLLWLTYGP